MSELEAGGEPQSSHPQKQPFAPRFLLVVLLSAGVVLFLWFQARYAYLVDDAYITFRYARNVVEGHGPVFNPGDAAVEGYSSPAWMVIMAAGMFFGANPEKFSVIASIFCGVAILALFTLWSRRVLHSTLARGVALVWLGTNYSFLSWGSGGLETMFHAFTSLVVLVSYHHWIFDSPKKPVRAALLCGVACAANALVRPEGYLLAFLASSGALLGTRAKDFSPGIRQKTLAVFLIMAALPILVHLGWRFYYYGDLLPNTFYAKATDTSPSHGLLWVLVFLGNHFVHWGVFLLLVVLFVKGIGKAGELQRKLWLQISILLLVHAAYFIYIGVDIFEFRFMVQVLPAFALWIGLGLQEFENLAPGRRIFQRLAAGFLIVANLMPVASGGFYLDRSGELRIAGTRDWIDSENMENWRLIGRWLKKYARYDESIAVAPAGLIPYMCNLRTLDLLGLNDWFIARQRGQQWRGPGHNKIAYPSYVSKWAPTYLLDRCELDTKPRPTRTVIAVEIARGRYLNIRTLDQSAETLGQKLHERGAKVFAPAEFSAGDTN